MVKNLPVWAMHLCPCAPVQLCSIRTVFSEPGSIGEAKVAKTLFSFKGWFWGGL